MASICRPAGPSSAAKSSAAARTARRARSLRGRPGRRLSPSLMYACYRTRRSDIVLANAAFGNGGTVMTIEDMSGRHVAVLGGTAGIGLETARLLARRGARLTIGSRDPQRLGSAVEQL